MIDQQTKCPTIGVVIPYYNGAEYWGELVESLSKQTSKLDEVVIVLDGADQSLEEIDLKGMAKTTNIIQLQKNMGVANARNIGVDSISSDYLFFLDQDDYFYPERVETVRNEIARCDSDWFINSYNLVGSDGSIIKSTMPSNWVSNSNTTKRLEKQFMYSGGFARISTVCCRKSACARFDSAMGSCDDFAFMFSLLERSPPIVIDYIGNARRYHSSNFSKNAKHRQSQIRTNSALQRIYNFRRSVRRKSLSVLCFHLAVESMVNQDRSKAVVSYLRARKLDPLNYRAWAGLYCCKLFENPVKVINITKRFLNILHLSGSSKMVGS